MLTESRSEAYHSEYEEANIQGKFGLDAPGSSVANLTLNYTPYWNPSRQHDHRLAVNGDESARHITVKLNGYHADVNGDYEFALGPGRLKLIGLRHWEHAPEVDTSVTSFDGRKPDEGTRFSRDAHLGETIGRGEYHWKTGDNDWQVTFERAFNSLDQKGGLFDLDPDGNVRRSPVPGRQRQSHRGALRKHRDAEPAARAQPRLAGRCGRRAFDPRLRRRRRARAQILPAEGQINFGWHPSKSWDVSLKLRRRVGQIDFSDFISQQQLSSDRENAGNRNLVPPQSWEVETEFAHDLGAWGKTRLNLHYYRVEDIIDVIPIGEDGQGIGNLPSADRLGFESNSTLLFDPIGWKGAKLDVTLGAERTRVRDPLTGEKRAITGVEDRWGLAQLRHDIPRTQIAWSTYVQYRHYSRYFYLTEVYSSQDLPWIAGFYVEDKNVFGTTVRFTVDNVLNGRHLLDRTVYTGFRDRAPIDFIEKHNELVGPIFSAVGEGELLSWDDAG